MVETGEKSLALAYGINSLIRQENISNKAEQAAQVPFHLCEATKLQSYRSEWSSGISRSRNEQTSHHTQAD